MICLSEGQIQTDPEPSLTHFWPMFPSFTPLKYPKVFGFLVFSGCTKMKTLVKNG